jgi:hypothetical protein
VTGLDAATDSGHEVPGLRALDRVEASVFAVVTVVFVAMEGLSFTYGTLFSGTSDAFHYFQQGHHPLLSLAFVAGKQPPMFPLVWKLLGFERTPLLVFNVILATLAWLWLAWESSRVFRHRSVRMTAFAVLLLLALAPVSVTWVGGAGTESLSISLFCLGLAAALALVRVREPRPRLALWIALAAITLAWAFTRDANAYFLPLAAVAFMGWFVVAFAHRRRAEAPSPDLRLLAIPAALLVVFGLSYASTDHGNRWAYHYNDIVMLRILPDRARTEWFADHGMPVAEAREMARRYQAGADLEHVTERPGMERLHEWVQSDARRTWTQYLVSHPGYFADEVSSSLDDLLSTRDYDSNGVWWGFHQPPTRVLTDVVFPHSSALLLLWALLAAGALGVVARRGGATDRRWVYAIVAGGVISLGMFAAVWAADAFEVPRHEVGQLIALRLLLWFATLFAVDRLLPSRPAPRSPGDDDQAEIGSTQLTAAGAEQEEHVR